MLRLLLIPLAPCALPTWSADAFQLDCATDTEDGIQRLTRQPYDAVVVVASAASAGASQLGARLEEACGAEVVPLVLAADGRDPDVGRALDLLPFDAFVDLSWSAGLIERCLGMAVSRVRAGRGVVEIQHQVLRAVRDEVAQLKDQSLRDEVSGLYNLRYFREVLAREHSRCERQGRGYALVRLELEGLSALNAAHGHAVGSQALARVGMTLQTLTHQGDFAFRVSGNRFVALLNNADRASAEQFALRVCKAMQACVLLAGGTRVPLLLSAGVGVFPQDGAGAEAVLARADAPLAHAEQRGLEPRRATAWRMDFVGGNQG